MRDIVFTLIIFGVLPTCFRRPFIGLVTFSWLAYMRTQDLTWGFAREQRWSYLVGAVTFAGFFLKPRERLFVSEARTWIMIGLVAVVGIGVYLSEGVEDYQVGRYMEFVKIVVIALFTTVVVRHREHLRILMWVIALSFGFFGVKVGLAGVLTGGSLRVLQGPGGMLEDNNDFSLALAMAIPVLVSIYASEKRAIFRKAMMVVIPLTIITILLTYSRGGFLSLATVMFALVWRSQRRWRVVGWTTVGFVVALFFIPQEYFDRIASIKDYETEGSAAGRLMAWRVAIRMALANPVFGVGYLKFQQHYTEFAAFRGEYVRVAHNSYLQIWAECGTIALVMYLVMILLTFMDLWRIRRLARQRYFASWIINYATMFEASMLCFVVGGTFLNRAHFDLFYHFVAIILVFGRIARREMSSEAAYPVRTGSRAPLRAVPGQGFGRGSPGQRGFRARPAGGLG